MKLAEGGNVFKDEDGQPLTRRITQAEVMPTVQWLEKITGLDFTKEKSPEDGLPVRWLGTTGRKPTSGDLDLQVDVNDVTKEQLISKLQAWAQQNQVQPERYIRKSGSAVHFLTAIDGNPRNGFAQTDFMFTGKPRWNQFVLQSDPASAFKGASRNILINSMAKSMGYKLNQNDGIADRATNQIITDDPDRVAPLLLNPRATVKDLYSVERILAALKNDPQREQKLADFRDHMQRAGTPLDENVEIYQEYNEVSIMARLRDRIVNQGMQIIVEGVRIEHPEDMIFDMGSRGLRQALAGIKQTAKSPGETTVKWDGKPAIIFGRKPTGEFVLTDKSGFLAKGYDGLATSPEQIEQIMAQRGGERGELVAIYRKLFPMLRRAVPQDFRGYIQGDLLFVDQPKVVNGAYEFQPNTVKYRVPVDSELGQKISDSEVGVVIHTALSEPGAPASPIRAAALEPSAGLLILDPSLREPRRIKLNNRVLQDAERLTQQYGAAIDQLFNPAELRQRRITNLPQLMKQYINSRVRSGSYDNLIAGFGQWIQQREPAKAPRIFEWATENKQAVAAVFQAFLELSSLKNDLVRQLDAQAQDVQASINDEPGHEGYVGQGMKFVDRMRFSSANFARNNPDLT
jgi:nucleotide-binding universal stress UspA family protein